MRSWRFASVGVALLIAALCLSGCSLWNRVAPGKGGEQTAVKEKAPVSSKEQAAAAPAPAAEKPDKPEAKQKDEPKQKDKEGEKPLTESQAEWEERIIRSPKLVTSRVLPPAAASSW